MNILVVDDSAMTRMVAKKTLNSLGFDNVQEGEDGVQALEIFKEQSIDVVFTDWNMPNMNGLELLIEIRKINKDVPIIMVTTEGSRSKIVEAVQNGINDYLVKPFTPDSLKEKLTKWVSVTA
ncbi:MAG: response regulator [Planctomycetaceae bacterium]|nr:response regulator [Planctomycetaceae bacterium]